jgi:peptidyl-prolyl cis-trans isomerase-like protein 2
VFTDHTKIVAIKTSGQVYTADTVEELNRKPKLWKDLLTGDVFTYKDIIVLQDPKNIESRTIKNFDFLKNNLKLD